MAHYWKIFLAIFLIGTAVPMTTQAWVSKGVGTGQKYKTPFRPKWVSRVKKGAMFKYKRREMSSPVAGDGKILVGADSGYFYAFSQQDGDKQWRFEADGPINSGAATGNGKVFFGDDDGNFYALNLDTGDLAWKERLGSAVTVAPLLHGNRLFIVTIRGTVYALDSESGRRIWSYPYRAAEREMTMLGHGAPAYSSGRLYVGFSDGHMLSIDAGSGRQQWSRDLSRSRPELIDVDMKPLIVGDRIYAATFAGDLYCLNRKSGTTIWQVAIGSGVQFTINNDVLYVSGSDGVLYALNAQDGSQRWKYVSHKGALGRPLVYKDLVIVGSTKHSIIFVDALNGHKIMQRFARRNIYSDPILTGDAGNLLVYISGGGRVYALQLKDDFRIE